MSERPLLPASKMLGQSWDVPGVGRVRLLEATRKMRIEADETWPLLRFSYDAHKHWRWMTIMEGMPERFALIDAAGHVAALWCSAKKRALQLADSSCYRLDYIEIHPKLRRGVFGMFAFSTVAARALEADCDYLVLGALPAAQKFYMEAGGRVGLFGGWKPARGLLPFYFPREVLSRLKEQIDGLIIESEDA
jgi:hypothetical protein